MWLIWVVAMRRGDREFARSVTEGAGEQQGRRSNGAFPILEYMIARSFDSAIGY